MNSPVEPFDAVAGWAGSVAGITFGLNQIPEYIAGLNTASMVVFFPAGSNGQYAEKTYDFDMTNFDEVVFHFWSRNKKYDGSRFQLAKDFAYSMTFFHGTDPSETYLILTFDALTDVCFKLSDKTITKIRINCLHNDEDYVIISNMVAVRDELPKDVFQAVKDQLTYDLNSVYGRITGGTSGKGILIGTASATTGDKSVLFSDSVKFLQRYAVIMIDDGVKSERHQIDDNDELEFFFNSNYDGRTILNNYTNANVYLVFPVEFGLSEKEIILPGIAIWGMNPEEIYAEHGKTDTERDSFSADDESVLSQKFQAKFRYTLLIDCEARHNELLAFMSMMVRYFISRQHLWINGRKIELFSEGPSSFIEPSEGFNEIPKIQYTIRLDVKEDVFSRERLVKTMSNVVSYALEEQP